MMDIDEAVKEFLDLDPKDLGWAADNIIQAIKLAIEIEINIECEIAVDEAQKIIDQ